MDISASELLSYIDPQASRVSIRTQSGDKCREISLEDLKVMIAAGHVVGLARKGHKLREIRLTVPPDVAFREVGETRAKVKDQLHSDASLTTCRSDNAVAKHIRKHHRRTGLWLKPMGDNNSTPTPSMSNGPTARDISASRDYAEVDGCGEYRYSVDEVRRKYFGDNGHRLYRALSLTGTPLRTGHHYAPPGPNPIHRERREAAGPVAVGRQQRVRGLSVGARPAWFTPDYERQTNTYFVIADGKRWPANVVPVAGEREYGGDDRSGGIARLLALRQANPNCDYRLIERLR
jgi:hypothetical protein